MVRTLAVHKFTLSVEALASKTVKPFIFTEVYVSRVVNFLKDLLYHCYMRRIGGSDKIIVLYIKFGPQVLKKCADIVNIPSGA